MCREEDWRNGFVQGLLGEKCVRMVGEVVDGSGVCMICILAWKAFYEKARLEMERSVMCKTLDECTKNGLLSAKDGSCSCIRQRYTVNI